MVKPKVRMAAISEFLRCSQRVHTIAFMQWRNKFDNPKLKKIEKQLIAAIAQRMTFIYGRLIKKAESDNTHNSDGHNPDINEWTVSEKYIEKKYKNVITRAKSYNIWSFEQIGLFDPFPSEPIETTFSLPKTEEDLVYRGDRYNQENSPVVTYFPSKLVLYKLMRACIGVETVEDLWFNQDNFKLK